MAEHSAITGLGYAPNPAWYRRRLVRRTGLLTILVGVAWFGWQWGPAAYHHSQYLYWQRQCMDWSVPPGTVAYEDDPNRVPALLVLPDYKPMPLETAAFMKGQGYAVPPIAILQAPSAAHILPSNALHHGIIFMHRLRSPGGNNRLVVVRSRVWKAGSNGFELQIYYPLVISPASRWSLEPGRVVGGAAVGPQANFWSISPHNEWDITGEPTAPFEPSMRLYAGQVDPVDSSHYTVAYDFLDVEIDENGQKRKRWRPGVLHGWLRDNDTVEQKWDGLFPG